MDELSAFLHSPAWERFQQAAGAEVKRHKEQLFIKRTLALGGSYWQSSRCDIPSGWQLPIFSEDSWFLRLEPADRASYENLINYANFQRFRLVPTATLQPHQTTILDLTQSEDTLYNNLHSKHRYNIRLAEREGVTTQLYTENLSELFPRFWHLLMEASKHQGFRTHPASYYQHMLQELSKEKKIRLGFAAKDGRDLAVVMIVTHHQTATYVHGASDRSFRNLMGPHLLLWEMIKALKKDEIRHFDMWGINVEKDEKGEWRPLLDHPSSGTTRFKLRFGGRIVEYPGTFDLVINPFWYTVYKGFRGFRSRKRAFS